jgi:hypothetical protein
MILLVIVFPGSSPYEPTLTPEINCDQTVTGYPPDTSAVFLIAK